MINAAAHTAPSAAGAAGTAETEPASQPAAASTHAPTAVAAIIRAAWRENSEHTQGRYRRAM